MVAVCAVATSFLDRHLLSIEPPEMRIQFTEFYLEQIVHNTLSRELQRSTRSQAINAGHDPKVRKNCASTNLHVCRPEELKPRHQTCVQVTVYKAIMYAIEPRGDLMHKHSVSATNSVLRYLLMRIPSFKLLFQSSTQC